MTQPVFDIFDRELAVGDSIVVAFPDGTSAHQRVGEIIGITEKEQSPVWNYSLQINQSRPPIPVLEIKWTAGPYLPDKPTKLERISKRIVKL